MLVEFRVKNFRSIRDEQVFSMVASRDKTLEETNVIQTGVDAVPRLLRSAVVYGANASGKSNLISALKYMQSMVLFPIQKVENDRIFTIKPFLLDEETAASPTEFEITVLINGVRFEYGFSMNSDRILSEQLRVYKTKQPQLWFDRKFDNSSDKEIYKFGTGLTGEKDVWRKVTNPQVLFLSVATLLNSSDIKPVVDWFSQQSVIYDDRSNVLPIDYTVNSIAEEKKKDEILKLLNSADMHIDEILVNGEASSPMVFFLHSTKTKKGQRKVVPFHFEDESGGTRSLFAIGGPLFDILKNGRAVVVDELGLNLHPLLLREIVRYFHNPKTNTGNAQLVFSTHDATLLRPFSLFRRDQVWFTEKGSDQATELGSLAEFKARKTENRERNYLDGRYGAVPFLDSEFESSGK